MSGSIHAWYQLVVSQWAGHLGIEHKEAPLKKLQRVQEKAERSYNGNFSRVLDFVRSCLVATTVSQTTRAVNFVLMCAIVHTIKNRYDPDYDGEATGGYRDINLQLSFRELDGTPFEGYVFELQIILSLFLEVKSDEGHRRYVLCRNLRGD